MRLYPSRRCHIYWVYTPYLWSLCCVYTVRFCLRRRVHYDCCTAPYRVTRRGIYYNSCTAPYRATRRVPKVDTIFQCAREPVYLTKPSVPSRSGADVHVAWCRIVTIEYMMNTKYICGRRGFRFITDTLVAGWITANGALQHLWSGLQSPNLGTIYRGLPYFNPTDFRRGAPN